MSTSRSRLRSPSLAVVALAATLTLLVPGALVAHADGLETPPGAEAVAVASGEPGGDLVEVAEPVEPAEPAEAVDTADPADIVDPADAVEPADETEPAVEPVAESAGEPTAEPAGETVAEPAAETVVESATEPLVDPGTADEQAPAATLSLVGRNLAILYKKTDNFDPEQSLTNGAAQGIESIGLPRTRSYGVNLMVKF